MVSKDNTNGNYKNINLKTGQGVMIDGCEIHRVEFSDNAIVKAFLFPPIDKDLPEQGQEVVEKKFKLTGIYSDKDVKIVRASGGKIFPKHRHPGKEWIEVVKGCVTVYYYRSILAVGLFLLLFSYY